MANPGTVTAKETPDGFGKHNRALSRRTVQLTQQAITRLETAGKPVTLAAICETAREFDERGKGVSAVTLLRNPEAATLFRQHSPAWQARQKSATRVKRKRTFKVQTDERSAYHGLRAADLIELIESLKRQLATMETQVSALKHERDEARRYGDQALLQNTRQLAALSRLTKPNDVLKRQNLLR